MVCRPCLLVVLLATAGAVSGRPNQIPHTQVLALTNATVIDGRETPPRPDHTVVVNGSVIADVFPTGGKPLPANARVHDLRGHYVIPGLIDTHVHVSGGGGRAPVPRLRRALRGGITTVRSMAGNCTVLAELARQAAAGEIDSPDVYFSVLVIGRAGWENNPRRETMKAPLDPGPGCNNVVDEPGLDPSAIVGSAKALGASALKLYGDLSEDAVRRLTGEAHRQGLKVWAHAALLPARPSDLVGAGVDALSHAPYLVWEAVETLPPYTEGALQSAPFARVPPSDPVIDRVLESMAKRRVILDATLVLYALQSDTSAAAREEFRPDRLTYAAAVTWGVAVTRRARQLGVAVSTGTDAMGGDVDGELPNIHRELELLVQEAGFTPLQAIAAATSVAARAVGIEKTVGTIVPGQQADLVILSGNPLVDIRHTRQIRAVIKKGKLLEDTR